MTTDILEEQEFYDLMQRYRHAPVTNQTVVTEAYEAVKQFIRDNRDAIECEA